MYASGPLSVRRRGGEEERRRGEERTRERLGSASAFKVLGAEGGCRPLRDRRGTKTPERGGCCINIYTGKEGLPCWKLGGDEEGELERDEMKCKCLNEPLRDCWSTS